MTGGAAAVREIATPDRARFVAETMRAGEPVIMRGLARSWPAVQAAAAGALRPYLAEMDAGAPGDLLVGPPEIAGRFGYADGMAGFNFRREPATVTQVLDRLAEATDTEPPPALAAQAIPVAQALPGFAAANPMPLLEGVMPRLWIGNRTVTALHHDAMSNIAVVVAGRRRFTLLPPHAVGSLYLGPLEFTPNGTPVSPVDPDAPDLVRYPRFAAMLAERQVAELEPGDAIYIPYMWWHAVRSLDTLSVLANYWWSEAAPAQPGLQPIDALVHALLSLSALTPEQRAAWRPMFDALLFDDAGAALIPAERRGIRGVLGDETRTRLRRQLGRLMAS